MSLKDELERDRREVRRSHSASSMSNTKWRNLLQAVKEADIEIRQIVIKFVGVEGEKFVTGVFLHTPHAFVDTLEFGPIPLIAIEWLEFPRIAVFPRVEGRPPVIFQQDIGAVRAAIEATGKRYPLEERSRGLRVTAHIA